MNLINSNTPLKKIFLNSKFCKSRYPFVFDLNNPSTIRQKENLLLSVDSFTMNNTINNVNEYNNKISFNYVTPFTVSVPVGIYSTFSFKNYLNRFFLDNGYNIVVVYNHTQFKFSFASTVNISIINTVDNPTTCGYLIGIDKDINNNFNFPLNSVFPSYTINLNNMADFRTNYLHLRINEVFVDSTDTNGSMRNNIIRIPVNVDYGMMIKYEPVELDKFIVLHNRLSRFTVTLENENHEPINNIPDFQFSLKAQYVHELPENFEVDEGTLEHYFRQQKTEDIDDDDNEIKPFGT